MTDHDPTHDIATDPETTYCAVHPDRETSLRCIRCERYMCMKCAVQSPVGYICKECARSHDDKFFTGTNVDYVIVFAASAVLSGVGIFLLDLVLGGFLLFTLLLSLPIGGAVGEVALRLTGRRRGRYSGYVAVAGVVLGVLVFLLITGLIAFPEWWLEPGIYLAAVAFAAYGRYQMKI